MGIQSYRTSEGDVFDTVMFGSSRNFEGTTGPSKAVAISGCQHPFQDVHLTISVREAAQEARALCGMDESYVLTFRGAEGFETKDGDRPVRSGLV